MAFESRADIETASVCLFNHFQKFGLHMHVGFENKASKTEAMFFPASLEEAKHPDFCQPNYIILPNNCFISYTSSFKYLGAIITPELDDCKEIQHRIAKAKRYMGLLFHVFASRDISLKVKQLIYITGPLNTLLWGCETWAMKQSILTKVEAFHHTAIRRILHIG